MCSCVAIIAVATSCAMVGARGLQQREDVMTARRTCGHGLREASPPCEAARSPPCAGWCPPKPRGFTSRSSCLTSGRALRSSVVRLSAADGLDCRICKLLAGGGEKGTA